MNLIENIKEPVGHLTIEVLDALTGELKDLYEHKNMIMTGARESILRNMTNISNSHVNKIVLGTKGHKDGDYLTPKTAEDGFVVTRTELFSEETSDFHYTIGFEVSGGLGVSTITEDDALGNSAVTVSRADTTITYLIELGSDSGNNNGQVAYTEAALYAGDLIFSMRTFGVRLKDSSSKFLITWKITY